ncbi:MAG: response regulator [Deltaproteobacteria bacterium]|nr:response regulator [Deltaproteobacteria bacterium]
MEPPNPQPPAEAPLAPPQSVRTLVVDDDRLVRKMICDILRREGFAPVEAVNALDALAQLSEHTFDLMLCDINMPGLSGLELIERTLKVFPDMATIMVTASDQRENSDKVLALGAYGYLIKPFKTIELIINVTNALRRRQLEMAQRQARVNLELDIQERTEDLRTTLVTLKNTQQNLVYAQEEIVNRLMRVAEFRDNETHRHVQRMSHYSQYLAELAGMDEPSQRMIRPASALHDIGKIGIPDDVLHKPEKLTPAEYELMKTHVDIGYQILRGSQVPLLEMAAMVALHHHEKWDGTGYPKGLKGENIPLEARITAICDVFDALTNRRVYKDAFSWYEAVSMMRKMAGTHFDPTLVEQFLGNIDHVVAIKSRYPDD